MTSDFDQNLIIDESPIIDRSMHSNIDEEDDEEEGDFSDEIEAGEIIGGGDSDDFSSSFADGSGGSLSDIRRSCTVCDLSFYSMRQLSDHLRESHGIDKPFQCHVCKARFPYSSSLYNHTRIHSERKPFRCDECDAAFRWKNSLKHHKRFIHKVGNHFSRQKNKKLNRANSRKFKTLKIWVLFLKINRKTFRFRLTIRRKWKN